MGRDKSAHGAHAHRHITHPDASEHRFSPSENQPNRYTKQIISCKIPFVNEFFAIFQILICRTVSAGTKSDLVGAIHESPVRMKPF